MPALLLDIFRAIRQLAVSEAGGELLSTRRKAHLLQHEMYARLGGENEAKPQTATAPQPLMRCRPRIRTKRLLPSTTAP
jgi:hypothetical protein